MWAFSGGNIPSLLLHTIGGRTKCFLLGLYWGKTPEDVLGPCLMNFMPFFDFNLYSLWLPTDIMTITTSLNSMGSSANYGTSGWFEDYLTITPSRHQTLQEKAIVYFFHTSSSLSMPSYLYILFLLQQNRNVCERRLMNQKIVYFKTYVAILHS